MAVPTYDQFIEPIIRFLAQYPDGIDAKAAHEAAAETLQLSTEDKQQLLPSGNQPIYKNRAGWAHDRLKRAGLSSSPKHGVWKLTPEGIKFIQEHQSPFSPDLVEKLATGFLNVRLSPDTQAQVPQTTLDASSENIPSPTVSPDDRLAQALAELREAAAGELLEALTHANPAFFERIVLDLLYRMGYGGSRNDLMRVGGSGDAGIDGVISLDKLGLEKVYVQAKRWQSAVGRPELQAFYGALAGQKAKKGVFITTSAYTAQAIEFAKSVEGMVLIDGKRLTELMIDHEVGITAKVVKIPKLDSDYFDDEGV